MFQKPHMSSLSVCYSSLSLSHSLSFECYSPSFLLSLKALFLFLPVSLPSFSLSLSLYIYIYICFFSPVSLSSLSFDTLYATFPLFVSTRKNRPHFERMERRRFTLFLPPSLFFFSRFLSSRFLPFSVSDEREEKKKNWGREREGNRKWPWKKLLSHINHKILQLFFGTQKVCNIFNDTLYITFCIPLFIDWEGEGGERVD